ncbi:MAG: hypothetical protein HQ559_01440 [Lentisphaerae bacterium]|nr:hypothetical protein [Lentisphaerota bacterium]
MVIFYLAGSILVVAIIVVIAIILNTYNSGHIPVTRVVAIVGGILLLLAILVLLAWQHLDFGAPPPHVP